MKKNYMGIVSLCVLLLNFSGRELILKDNNLAIEISSIFKNIVVITGALTGRIGSKPLEKEPLFQCQLRGSQVARCLS